MLSRWSVLAHRSCALAILALFVFVFAIDASAQWSKVWTFNGTNGGHVNTIYFLDRQNAPLIGFAGLGNGNIWRTTDGGASWNPVSVPQTLAPALHVGVTDFAFKDATTGWCSIQDVRDGLNCWKTADGGLTWTRTTATGTFTSVAYTKPNHTVVLSSWGGAGSLFSTNDGASWTSNGPQWQNGTAFSDGYRGVMATYISNFCTTTDGGQSWINNNGMTTECWSPMAIPGTPNFFAINENGVGYGRFYRSQDYGQTWTVAYTFPSANVPTGDVKGTNSNLWVQTSNGFFVSPDQGTSWSSINGPGNVLDTRFYIGCGKIFAGDASNNLWTTPVVDPALQGTQLSGLPLLVKVPASGCGPVNTTITFFSGALCLPTLLDVTVSGSPAFTFVRFGGSTIISTTLDSAVVRYTPTGLPSADSAILVIRFIAGGTIITTTVPLYGAPNGPPQKPIITGTMQLAASICGDADSLMRIRVTGPCPMTIDGVILTGPPQFSLGYFDGSSGRIFDSVRVRYTHTAAPSSDSAHVKVFYTTGGRHFDTTITVFGNTTGSATRFSLSDSLLSFKTDVCAVIDSFVTFSAAGTCPIVVTRIKLDGSKRFTLPTVPTVPDTVSGLQSLGTRYKPGFSNDTALITITYISQGVSHDTTIRLLGSAKSVVEFENTQLELDTLLKCSSAQGLSSLKNASCDSLLVNGASLGLSNGFSISGVNLPRWLGPGDTMQVHARIDPKGLGDAKDSITLAAVPASDRSDTLTRKLALHAFVGSGQRIITLANLSNATLQLDKLPPCRATDSAFVIENHSECDTITLDAINVQGYQGVVWNGVPVLPIRLAPGMSVRIPISITPTSGNPTTSLVHLTGVNLDTNVLILTTEGPGGASAAFVPKDSIYTVQPCQQLTKSFTIQSTGCDSVTIDSVVIASLTGSARFQFLSLPRLPIRIAANESIDFTVQFDPQSSGDSLATVRVVSQSGGLLRVLPITGIVRGVPVSSHLRIVALDGTLTQSYVAGALSQTLLRTGDALGDSLGLTQLTCHVGVNTNVLTLATVKPVPGWTLIDTLEERPGFYRIRLRYDAGITIPAGSTIATLDFLTTVGDSDHSEVKLADARFNDNDPSFDRCKLLAVMPSANLVSAVTTSCGDQTIRAFLDGRLMSLMSIVPNPVGGAGSAKQVAVHLSLRHAAIVSGKLEDVQGRTLKSFAPRDMPAGTGAYVVELNDVPSGVYSIRLEAEGESVMARIVVAE